MSALAPLNSAAFGYEQARHLLNRAGFGGTPQQVAALQGMGLAAAVDHLVDFDRVPDPHVAPPSVDPDVIRPPNEEEKLQYARARREQDQDTLDKLRAEVLRRQGEDRRMIRDLATWWLATMITTARPLREKLTLLWHSHFATNWRSIHDAYLMYRQNDLFRTHAADSFAALVKGIVRDPAMIRYLNNDQNRKSAPNENLARELMELFTLGEGQYAERDIKEGARALTGYTLDDNDFTFNQRQHDGGGKVIFGVKGDYDGDGFADLILQRPRVGQWVAYKLYRHFVADVAEPAAATPVQKQFIQQLGRQITDDRYDLRPALKAMFRSAHFYDAAVVGQQVKSPAQLVVGSVRMLNTPVRDIRLLTDALDRMGQKLFEPPSVAGWDGGRTWINTSTLFVRQNVCTYLLTGKQPFGGEWDRAMVNYDPTPLVADLPLQTPQAVVDRLLATLIGGAAPTERRDQLVAFMKERGGHVTPDTLIAVLLLITALPEYQLC